MSKCSGSGPVPSMKCSPCAWRLPPCMLPLSLAGCSYTCSSARGCTCHPCLSHGLGVRAFQAASRSQQVTYARMHSATTATTTCGCVQVRAVLYTFTLTNTLMESVAALEQAVVAAVAHQASPWPCDSRPLAGHTRHLTPKERMARWALRDGSCMCLTTTRLMLHRGAHSGHTYMTTFGAMVSTSVQHRSLTTALQSCHASTLPACCHLLMQGECSGSASA